MLHANIASALKKIITNPHFKKRVNLKQQEGTHARPIFRGRQIAYMVYEYFRVTGAHVAVLDYTDLFSVSSCVAAISKILISEKELYAT